MSSGICLKIHENSQLNKRKNRWVSRNFTLICYNFTRGQPLYKKFVLGPIDCSADMQWHATITGHPLFLSFNQDRSRSCRPCDLSYLSECFSAVKPFPSMAWLWKQASSKRYSLISATILDPICNAKQHDPHEFLSIGQIDHLSNKNQVLLFFTVKILKRLLTW